MSYKNKLGYIHVFLAAVAEGVFGLFIQLIEGFEPEDIIGLNSVLKFLPLIPLVIYSRTQLLFDMKTMLVLVLRIICAAGAVSLLIYSYKFLPIGDVAAIFNCNPLFTMLLSMCFLRTRCHVFDILAVFCCLLGELFIFTPTFIFQDETNHTNSKTSSRNLGLAVALSSAVCESFALCLSQFISQLHFCVAPLYMTILIVTTWVIIVFRRGYVPNLWECSNNNIYLAVIAVLGVSIYLNLNLGLQVLQPGSVSVISSAFLPISYLTQVFILRDPGELKSYFGSTFVFLSIVMIGFKDFRDSFSLFVQSVCSCFVLPKRILPNHFVNPPDWKYSRVNEKI
ncbi:solute carrier family 35 member G1-like [Tachypleus tridentatus]|uniref:solute carrier family 35 member G1-like n=1 Tax=Tachypleus tridentatus TaxID=6853 RepID=UPI003FD1F41C